MTLHLESLCESIVDCEHKTAPSGDGYAFAIGTKAMKDGRLALEFCKPVSSETYVEWTRRLQPEPGDLVLAREAPVGQVVRVPARPRTCLGQRTVLIRADADSVNPRFLHYWLLGPEAQHLMSSKAAGATVPHLNVADIRSLDVEGMPTGLGHQATVAAVLGTIDDLIENNRRRVELLEEMARAVYREWFVHFRYPGHEDIPLVDSELGSIPQGWEMTALKDVASVERRSINPQRFADECFHHFSLPAFDGGQLPFSERGESIKSGKFTLHDPAVLVSKLNPRIERTWLASPPSEGRSITSTEFIQLRPTTGLPLGWIYLMVRSSPFQNQLQELSRGTSTSHQRTTPSDLLARLVCVPPLSVANQFGDIVAPMLELVHRLRSTSSELTQLRDLLLPRLVSGRIDVSDLDLDLAEEGAA